MLRGGLGFRRRFGAEDLHRLFACEIQVEQLSKDGRRERRRGEEPALCTIDECGVAEKPCACGEEGEERNNEEKRNENDLVRAPPRHPPILAIHFLIAERPSCVGTNGRIGVLNQPQ